MTVRLLCLFVLVGLCAQHASAYWIGTAKRDITGPIVGEIFMGYVNLDVRSRGISTRLFARSFVVSETESSVPYAFVLIDHCQSSEALKREVLKALGKKWGDTFGHHNLTIAATHTHSAPGSISEYRLYTMSTLGHSAEALRVVTEGVSEAIDVAMRQRQQGQLEYHEGEFVEGNTSRSPFSYLENPAIERARYAHNTDKTMKLLRFVSKTGKELGMMNWYPVHATAMDAKNDLISGDNKGYASLSLERKSGEHYVAAFINANAGDASPKDAAADLNGDRDWDCSLIESFACTERNGEMHVQKAEEIAIRGGTAVKGPIDTRFNWVDMSNVLIREQKKETRTCKGAIGLSMLAGAKDHRGIGKEGQRCSEGSLFNQALCLIDPCQTEKPVTIATGSMMPPWTPQILPVQLVRIGQIAMIQLPAEFTTMAGRRIVEALEKELKPLGISHVIFTGYANSYAGYVATQEEYQLQNYEGASTHFGQWTQAAYQQKSVELAQAMIEKRKIEMDAEEPNHPNLSIVRRIRTGDDAAPRERSFGGMISEAKGSYKKGQTVSVTFQGANPNHDYKLNGTFLRVERQSKNRWITVATDRDFSTRFIWEEPKFAHSEVTIQWKIPLDQDPGTYRIVYEAKRREGGLLKDFEGFSRSFGVEF